MEYEEILEAYKIIRDGYANSDWATIEDAMEYLSEFLDDLDL